MAKRECSEDSQRRRQEGFLKRSKAKSMNLSTCNMFTKLPVYDYDSDDSDVTLRKIPSSLSSESLPLQSEQVDDKNHRPLRRSLSSEEPEFPAILPEHPNFQYTCKTFSSNKGNSRHS